MAFTYSQMIIASVINIKFIVHMVEISLLLYTWLTRLSGNKQSHRTVTFSELACNTTKKFKQISQTIFSLKISPRKFVRIG